MRLRIKKTYIVSHPHIAFDHYPRISHAAASPNNNKHLWIIARIISSFLFLNSVENVKDVDLEGITTYIKQGATFEPVPGPKIFSACWQSFPGHFGTRAAWDYPLTFPWSVKQKRTNTWSGSGATGASVLHPGPLLNWRVVGPVASRRESRRRLISFLPLSLRRFQVRATTSLREPVSWKR